MRAIVIFVTAAFAAAFHVASAASLDSQLCVMYLNETFFPYLFQFGVLSPEGVVTPLISFPWLTELGDGLGTATAKVSGVFQGAGEWFSSSCERQPGFL